MKKIDLSSWKRKEHFEFFSKMDSPIFGIVTEVDCDECYKNSKENGISFFANYLHKSMIAVNVVEDNSRKTLTENELKKRADEWAKEVGKGGRLLAYEKRGPEKDRTVALIKSPGIQSWDNWTVPMSMREVEPGVRLIMNTSQITDDHEWKPRPAAKDED